MNVRFYTRFIQSFPCQKTQSTTDRESGIEGDTHGLFLAFDADLHSFAAFIAPATAGGARNP
jgi:hypothetical protein